MSKDEKIFSAVATGDLDEFRALIAERPDLARARNEQRLSLLMWLLYHQKSDWLPEIKPLIGELDFFEAVAVGDTTQVKLLLDDEPDMVNTIAPDGFQALGLASFFGRPDVVAILIACGADINFQAPGSKLSALHGAVAGKCIECVAKLLDAGADIDARQHGGYTALMAAAGNGLAEILKLLVEHNADLAVTDNQGNTARDLALKKGQQETARILS